MKKSILIVLFIFVLAGLPMIPQTASAQATEPFIGQLALVAFNFAPVGWQICQGQVLPISQNTALFSLLGTTYGGDGVQTFALPDLQGRVPLGQGQGAGLTSRTMGERGGAETHTLTIAEMPYHRHSASLAASPNTANSPNPGGAVLANTGRTQIYSTGAPTAFMASGVVRVSPTGGGQPHNIMQPYVVMNWIISLYGVFPSRN
ncbi:MAG: tail fiber protein [Syntrophobacteraceae bacterium]|nr:tail fiber protein [Syntrophobacteraceae bacterium]